MTSSRSRLFPVGLFLAMLVCWTISEVQAADLAETIGPFLDPQAFAVTHLDVAAAEPKVLLPLLTTLIPDRKPEIEKQIEVLQAWKSQFVEAGGREVFLVSTLRGTPRGEPIFLVVPLAPGSDEKKLSQMLEDLKLSPEFRLEQRPGALVGTSSQAIRDWLRESKGTPRPELTRAFAATKGSTLQVALMFPKDGPRILEENLPMIPEEFGGGSIKVLTRGLEWIALGVETKPDLTLRLTIQATDRQTATALNDLIEHNRTRLLKQPQLRDQMPELGDLLKELLLRVEGDRLSLVIDQKTLASKLAKPIIRVRSAAERMTAANNVKQVGIAMHNYLDTHGTFPLPGSLDPQKKPLLSWRVHLLPYLEQDALYRQFKLDEPWDSDHNKALIKQMPKVYSLSKNPDLMKEGKTTLVVPVGPNTIFPGGKPTRIADITDGTSNTILVVDVADEQAVIWTKPDDWKVDEKNPKKGLATRFENNLLASFADGSVRFLSGKIDPRKLAALLTRHGGEVISDD